MADASDQDDGLRQQILGNERVIAELNKNLARKTQEVRIVQEISADINSTLDLDEILRIILTSMDTVFGFQHSMVLLADEGEVLRVAASRGYEQSGIGAQIRFGQGPIGMVAKRRKMMRLGNIGTQVAYASAIRAQMSATEAGAPGEAPVLPGLPGVQSQVAIPLLVKDRLIGVFAVESRKPNIFDEADELLIGIVANQAASAIHNARLYETLEERVRERTEDLRRAQAQLVQSEKMASLGMLVAGIAHEINTPMGSIVSMHDTLFRAHQKLEPLATDPKAKAIFAVISDAERVLKTGSERVTTIVKRLRSFARLDEADRKEADLHEGIDDTLLLMRHELGGVTVEKRFGDIPPITCFPGRLNQVFLNVLMNACHAVQGKGTITIATSRVGDAVHVAIADDGVGIPAKDLPRVFDPGFTTKGVGVGTGLGLSICFQIIKDHDGDIRIDSEVGKGTTVTIVLPIRG